MISELSRQLIDEILMARQFVYEVAQPTPLQKMNFGINAEIYVKREDLSPINAYKWRGACNCMAALSTEQLARGVVTASAGNHAQGVAISAKRLGTKAKIFMPVSTPKMKQRAVALHGGEAVEICLHGESFDAASKRALEVATAEGKAFVHPYDDVKSIAGQGTIADEIVMSGVGEFDVAFLQIGGGGLAAGVGAWLKKFYPNIKLIGVEGTDQASMKAAFQAGKPVTLDYLDVFCDGTAVRRAGDITFPICRELLDDIVTVTNNEVCVAIQKLWEACRCIPEPAGALGLAGLLKHKELLAGKRALVIVSGANMDFSQFTRVSNGAMLGSADRKFLRFQIDESPGSLFNLIQDTLNGISIVDFQYGQASENEAWPTLGIQVCPHEWEHLKKKMDAAAVRYEDVTGDPDVEFRMISFNPLLCKYPLFMTLEFHERAGALSDFLAATQKDSKANICYFNYSYTGERVGRVLIGFDFKTDAERIYFRTVMAESKSSYRAFKEIAPHVFERIVKG